MQKCHSTPESCLSETWGITTKMMTGHCQNWVPPGLQKMEIGTDMSGDDFVTYLGSPENLGNDFGSWQ